MRNNFYQLWKSRNGGFCYLWGWWFMSSCKMLLTGCFEWSNGIWKNAFMEEIFNKLCSLFTTQVQKILLGKISAFGIFSFYRVFPNHKGFQSNDHLGYIAPIMCHRSNIGYCIFLQPSLLEEMEVTPYHKWKGKYLYLLREGGEKKRPF